MRCAVGGDVTEPADEYAARQSCHLSRLMLLRAARRTGVEVARCGTERKFFNDFSRACACGCAQGRVRSESAAMSTLCQIATWQLDRDRSGSRNSSMISTRAGARKGVSIRSGCRDGADETGLLPLVSEIRLL